MNTFTLGACFQHELHTGPYFMTFAARLLFDFQAYDSPDEAVLLAVWVYLDTGLSLN